MDMGAEGLMLPMVSTPTEARQIVHAMKYHPAGGRGVALQVAHDRYRPGAVPDKFAAANKRSTLFCQIETAARASRTPTRSPSIDGVDALWVGHFDLSVSLGIPGEFDHPEFKRAIDRTVAACQKHGKALGRLVPDGRTRRRTLPRRASISSATPAMSGCCTMRWRRRSTRLREGVRAKRS